MSLLNKGKKERSANGQVLCAIQTISHCSLAGFVTSNQKAAGQANDIVPVQGGGATVASIEHRKENERAIMCSIVSVCPQGGVSPNEEEQS